MLANSALATIAAATAAGLAAQLLGARLRIPALVPLLALGMLLGPSGLGLIQPGQLGTGLPVVVKLCVAVILFDGALNLRLSDLRHGMREVRNLVTVGLLVTWAGALLVAWLIGGLPIRVAVVFGALLTVTGPTVVQPILRRVRIPRRLKTILEGEAILIDPIGAVLAVAVVDVVLGFAGAHSIGIGGVVWGYVGRLVVGGVVGIAGAWILSALLRHRSFVPAEFTNLVALAAVWGAFALAEAVQSESGIMAAVAMGLAVQRGAVPEEWRLRRFKEQLTVLSISLLFVLLSANLPVGALIDEGWRGIGTVAGLILVVRPVSVWVALRKTTLTWREQAFIAWISPRGIVAASVASLFALELSAAGLVEGQRVLALTFLTIAVTVTLQGLTAAHVARLLGLESLLGQPMVIVGAGPLALAFAKAIRPYGRPIVIVDRNRAFLDEAKRAGFEIVVGNALDETVLAAAGADDAETLVAMTTNPEVNALAAHLGHDAFGIAQPLPLIADPRYGAGPQLLDRVGGAMAFGRPIDLREWDFAFAHERARTVVVRLPEGAGEQVVVGGLPATILPLARSRGHSVEVATAAQAWRGGDHVIVATSLDEKAATAAVHAVFRANGPLATAAT
jgi:NhaP-type Na+/H+ or K+/H+ antiporter